MKRKRKINKYCKKCGNVYVPNYDKYGRNHGCTACDKLWKEEYLKKHPEQKNLWYKNKKDSIEYKLNAWANHIRRKYWPSLTAEEAVVEYKKLFDRQNGRCALCDKPQSHFKRKLHVDHDHKTKINRRLLCLNCNQHID